MAAEPAAAAERRAIALFAEHFGGQPAYLVRAPGRVNLIGDHTDYNDGFVLPMALDRSTWIAGRPRSDDRVICRSDGYEDLAEFGIGTPIRTDEPTWSAYLEGTGRALFEDGLPVTGWEGAIASDVPVGAGLSSSAAIEMAAARAFLAGRDGWDPVRAALAGRRAENDWVGVATGIMDQLVSAAAVAGHALLIDCRDLEMTPVPLPDGLEVFVLDTTTRRELTDSGYDERRRECERAAVVLGVSALRDAAVDDIRRCSDDLGPLLESRARHVVTENERVQKAAQSLRDGDPETMGQLMSAGHRSLRDQFEISTPIMESMVRAARRAPGCYGVRMTGGGFGGCAVALVDSAAAEEFAEKAVAGFRSMTGLVPNVYHTRGGTGSSLRWLDQQG